MTGPPSTIVRLAVAITVAVGAAVVTAAPEPGPPVAQAAAESQRVLLVSDSVGLGTRGVLEEHFPADWEVNVIGTPAYFVEQLRDRHVIPTIALQPWQVGDHVVVAGGYNYPFWDPVRFDQSIDSMVNTLSAAGVEHVYWVTLREVKPQYISAGAWRQVQPYYWYFPTVNEHLRRALDRHPNLTLVDWAAAADRPGITYDAIHLNRTGADLYSGLIASAVHSNNTRPPDGAITTIDVTDDPDVAAVALNVAAARGRRTGFLTAFPCGSEPPLVANVTFERDLATSSAALVPVDDEGRVCVFHSAASQVIVDASGTFGSEALVVAEPPNRVFDSRDLDRRQPGGTTRRLSVAEPGSTTAVALNVTGLDARSTGYITAHPCDSEPTTATVNLGWGETVPNLVLVAPDRAGEVCITVNDTDAHVVVDRFVSFAAPPDAGADGDPGADGEGSAEPGGETAAPLGAIETITPERVVDTRTIGGRGTTVRFDLADTSIGPANDDEPVTAVFVNVAVIRPDGTGFATAWPCTEPQPTTASVNYSNGRTRGNFVTVTPDANGEICVATSTPADLAIDVLGATRRGFDGFTPERVADTRP